MLFENEGKKVVIWTTKCSKTNNYPMIMSLHFNRHSNELEFCDRHLFCKHYSIEELESMLIYLKKKNKEVIMK